MDDLIRRSALIKEFDPEHYFDWYTPSIIETINEQPTVDAVSVEEIQNLKNPYSPFKYQDAFVGFETAKCQLLMKYGREKQDGENQ